VGERTRLLLDRSIAAMKGDRAEWERLNALLGQPERKAKARYNNQLAKEGLRTIKKRQIVKRGKAPRH
jgi:hypothetical protein